MSDNKIGTVRNSDTGSVPDSPLSAIERHFHEVIRGRAADFLELSPDLALPTISDTMPTSEEKASWFAVPGMYGGFKYWFDLSRDQPTLISESWCRVVGGSGERHEINVEGITLVDKGFV